MISFNSRHTCDLCGRQYWGRFADGAEWDGLAPCPCGGAHRICGYCAARLDLLDNGEFGSGVPLKACPLSDEFRVGLSVLGEDAVVAPRPRGER